MTTAKRSSVERGRGLPSEVGVRELQWMHPANRRSRATTCSLRRQAGNRTESGQASGYFFCMQGRDYCFLLASPPIHNNGDIKGRELRRVCQRLRKNTPLTHGRASELGDRARCLFTGSHHHPPTTPPSPSPRATRNQCSQRQQRQRPPCLEIPPGGLPDGPVHVHEPSPRQAKVRLQIPVVCAPVTVVTAVTAAVFDSGGRPPPPALAPPTAPRCTTAARFLLTATVTPGAVALDGRRPGAGGKRPHQPRVHFILQWKSLRDSEIRVQLDTARSAGRGSGGRADARLDARTLSFTNARGCYP